MIRALVEQTFDATKKYFVLAGLSTDSKPTTGLITGSKFLEVDTGTNFAFDEVSGTWSAATITMQDIKDEIDSWLENNIDPDSGYVLDRTLSLSNAAAPADMVGDLKSAINPLIPSRLYQADEVGNMIIDAFHWLTNRKWLVNAETNKLIDSNQSNYKSFLFPVQKNTDYAFTYGRYVYLIDSDMETALSATATEKVTTINSGNAYFLAISFDNTSYPVENYVICKGTTITGVPSECKAKLPWLVVEESNIDSDIFELKNNKNILQSISPFTNKYYDTSEHTSNSYSYFIIPVTSGNSYILWTSARNISKEGVSIFGRVPAKFIYTADFTGNLYVTFDNTDESNWKVFEAKYYFEGIPSYNEHLAMARDPETVHAIVDKYINKNNILQGGIIYSNYYYSSSFYSNNSYTVIVIPVISGVTYLTRTAIRYLSKNGEIISQSLSAGATFTTDFNGYLYITLYNSDYDDWKVFDTTVNSNAVPAFNEYVMNSMGSRNNTASDMFNGKKWYACGDSFTHGDFDDYTGQYTFTDQPYKNENMVYPFFIGRRTGINVVNQARNGMTLAVRDGSDNNFINYYQNIGSDADYITIKIGINDSSNRIPIGNITDGTHPDDPDDPGNRTFYGAYNIVMTWIIANRPTAKIGIIVPNGLSRPVGNDYADAIINIAKKYGIPYLNEWNGIDVPTLIRSGRADLDDDIREARNLTFRCAENNMHPNPICHELESTFVETWLRTL